MRRAGNILRKLILDHGLDTVIALSRIEKRWEQIVGTPVAMHTHPESIKNGILFVTVDTPQWMHHLGFFKMEILEKLSEQNITEVRLRLGKLPVRELSPRAHEAAPLTDEEQRYIERTVSSLQDGELRQRFRSLIAHSLRHGKGKN